MGIIGRAQNDDMRADYIVRVRYTDWHRQTQTLRMVTPYTASLIVKQSILTEANLYDVELCKKNGECVVHYPAAWCQKVKLLLSSEQNSCMPPPLPSS